MSSEEEFDYYVTQWKRERFITELFSKNLKFEEVLNYAKYLDEETDYITMHKTKGTSISSVIVIMEEYFWNEYDFSLLYRPDEISFINMDFSPCSFLVEDLCCVFSC